MRNVLALTVIVWSCGAGVASAQPGIEAFTGFTSAVLVGDSAESVLATRGLDVRLSVPIAPGTRLEGMTTVGGPGGDRLSGVQLLRERRTIGSLTTFSSYSLMRAHEPGSPGVKSYPVLGVGGGFRDRITSRVGLQYDLQWLFPWVGFRTSLGATVRLRR
jgi:hypothetical protein